MRNRIEVVVDMKRAIARTKQSFKDECDINRIMGRFIKTGAVDHVNVHGPRYGECSSQTFHEAMNIVARAEQMFADLPAALRKRFHHSAEEFLAFVGDGKNQEEAEKLGLCTAPRIAEIMKVEVVKAPDPAPDAPGAAIAATRTPVQGGGANAPATQ